MGNLKGSGRPGRPAGSVRRRLEDRHGADASLPRLASRREAGRPLAEGAGQPPADAVMALAGPRGASELVIPLIWLGRRAAPLPARWKEEIDVPCHLSTAAEGGGHPSAPRPPRRGAARGGGPPPPRGGGAPPPGPRRDRSPSPAYRSTRSGEQGGRE